MPTQESGAKMNIKDNLPVSTDTTEGAAMSRIKFYRNEIAHNDSGTLTEKQFHQLWEEASQAITLLGGQHYMQRCSDLKVCSLDSHDREILIEIRNMRSENIPKGATVVHNSLLEEWSNFDEKVVQTRAIKRILERLEEEHVLTVIGPPGCGKSTAIHHAALQLRDQEDYVIVPVNFPGEIKQYYNPKCKQVFVYDDMCGKYAINLQMLDNWCTLSTAIQVILSRKNVKILSSCRNYIFKDRLFSKVKLLSEVYFDITSANNALSEKERSLIAEVYLSPKEVLALQKSNNFTKYDFFPLLCQLYSTKESSDVVVYFSDPIKAINVELESQMNETDQTTLATLFLFVIYNNCIDENVFNQRAEIRNILLNLSDHFLISSVLSINVVKLHLNKLINSFVKKCANAYSTIHDKIFDILVLFCGKMYFDLCLEVAHTDLIRDRFQLSSLHAKTSDGIVIVAVSKEDAYFDRISNDIRNGHIANVFTNSQMKYISYQQKIIAHLKKTEDLLKIVLSLSEKESSPLLTVANQGFNFLVHSLIDIGFTVNVRDQIGRSPLFLATDSNHTVTADLLLNKAANPDLCNNKQVSPFHMACLNENIEIVKLLVNSKCNIDIQNDYDQTPLFFASFVGQKEIVKFLLENKCDVNINSKHNNTPLHAACYFDNVEVVQLLLDFKCDPNISSVYNESPLFVACMKNSILSTELLLETGCNPNVCTQVEGKINPWFVFKNIYILINIIKKDKNHQKRAILLELANSYENVCAEHAIHSGMLCFFEFKGPLSKPDSAFNMTLLYIASINGFTDVVELLLNHNANPCLGTGFNETPIFSAAEKGRVEIVKLLLKFKADPNLFNKHNVCLLQRASLNGFSEVVYMLVIHGGNPNHYDGYTEPAVNLATRQSFYETVQILLQLNGDPNIPNFEGKTCLHIASENGDIEMVKILLENHADPNILDNDLISPLFVASKSVHVELFYNYLVRNAYLDDDLILYDDQLAPPKQCTAIVKLLLRYKADPFSVFESGFNCRYNIKIRS
ncbi:Hypothetical predicted protein [Mytilus galloprovincialis]|uniref:DZIP3-like HEPN domain-containing protein n=1 Tax=Mytilus galloprovincialis TaxID=29158 RepID=A0A8B6GVZ6_MYTGA|nr:Hypothetical predicted protein [Mytilus galloprovincialis]